MDTDIAAFSCYNYAMSSLPSTLPNTVAELQHLLIEQQRINQEQAAALKSSQALNQALEQKLRLLNQKHFAKSSEKNPGQAELQFLNEAEMLHAQEALKQSEASNDAQNEEGEIDVPAHKRKRRKSRELLDNLPEVDVIHDLSDEEKQCSCGLTMSVIGEEVLRQLGIVPQQFYVIVHRKLKYACTCKSCMRTATMPVQPIPGSQASPPLMGHVMSCECLHRLKPVASGYG